MTDIVEWLKSDARACSFAWGNGNSNRRRMCEEAAAEIERLRAALTNARNWIEAMPTIDSQGEDRFVDIHKLLREIEAALADEQTQKAADEPLPHFREMRGIFK